VQLRDAIAASGLIPPPTVTLDGKLHRFKSGSKGAAGHGDKPGWYIAYGDGIPAGRFGCWRSGLESSWRADIGRAFSPAEEMAHTRRMAEAKATRDAELARTREIASNNVDFIFSNAIGAAPEHPYLTRKGIQPHGARITGDGRLVQVKSSWNGYKPSKFMWTMRDMKYAEGEAWCGMVAAIAAGIAISEILFVVVEAPASATRQARVRIYRADTNGSLLSQAFANACASVRRYFAWCDDAAAVAAELDATIDISSWEV
jgi:hypothetical protein